MSKKGIRATHTGDAERKKGTSRVKRVEYTDEFLRFWAVYPPGRKTGKKDAYRAWKVAVRDVDAEEIIEAAAAYAASPLGQSRFVKSPGPWLRAGCWEDDRQAWEMRDEPQTFQQLKAKNTLEAGRRFLDRRRQAPRIEHDDEDSNRR